MKVLGIDPGFHGAAALVEDDQVLWIKDCPTFMIETAQKKKRKKGKKKKKTKKPMFDLPSLANVVLQANEDNVDFAVLEKVGPMPKQGVASCFRFGEGSMAWEMALVTCGVKYIRPRPQSWMKMMLRDVPGKGGKGRSILACRRLFPQADLMLPVKNPKPSHDRAEAILMAAYGIRLAAAGEI